MAKYKPETCPISQFAEILGDGWGWLILREAFRGTSRFSDFRRETGIAKNILKLRIDRLVENGLIERKNMGISGQRYEYFLTLKGRSLEPIFLNIFDWSKDNLKDERQ
ncbi:hypothetical protein R50073_43280 [Maricurvus nonylphenolicus]|uniref:winged helix-turn-helix transcriptional regulator n=1 Tax=Maricurvus nonylphenolicus TaxID=1008307 RepID=UPI0036F2A6E3